ncbi:MAG: hypothetical protein IJI75_08385 [Solobacterium sp.]|nr:hypothetical protein [Solobacterium sp.]
MKHTKPMILLLSGLLLTGCSSGSKTPANTPETGSSDPAPTQKAEQQKPAKETAAAKDQYAGFQIGQTVYDDNDIVIQLKKISDDKSYLTVEFDVENNMSGKLRINVQNIFVDNCTAVRRRMPGNDLAPGEKGTLKEEIEMSYFPFYIEDAPSMIDLQMDIWDLDQNRVVDKCSVSLNSDPARIPHPEELMTLLGEMHEPHEIKYYKASEADMYDSTCYMPQALPARALALRQMPEKLRQTFIHPSCMGRNWGDHFYIIYFEETDDESHTYEVINITFNGKTVDYHPSIVSIPGRGSFIRFGIPDDMEQEDVTSLTFTITCDGGSPVDIDWIF